MAHCCFTIEILKPW